MQRSTFRSPRAAAAIGLASIAFLAAGCSGSDGATSTSETTAAPTTATPTTAAPTTVSLASATTAAADEAIVNTWTASAVDPSALPIGNDLVSTTSPAIGALYVCDAGNPNGGGAFAVGTWIDEAAGTWDSTQKVKVQGEVSWPTASYSETNDGTNRVITSGGLPVDVLTGTFPVAADDPAYSFDRNPNTITGNAFSVTLPSSPTEANSPSCLPKGPIGVLRNGVAVFASVDALNRDAVAYETQDLCDGHPEQSGTYHYHDVPSCLQEATVGSSTVVGFAFDGFPIVVERDASGALPTNADLDECHGRRSPIELDGAVVTMYHYSTTLEFPYFMGCYRGSAQS